MNHLLEQTIKSILEQMLQEEYPVQEAKMLKLILGFQSPPLLIEKLRQATASSEAQDRQTLRSSLLAAFGAKHTRAARKFCVQIEQWSLEPENQALLASLPENETSQTALQLALMLHLVAFYEDFYSKLKQATPHLDN